MCPLQGSESKADVILGLMGTEKTGLFVDDDIHEHSNRRLKDCERLHRVLFVRTI